MYLDTDVSELKSIYTVAKKLIGKNTGAPNSILLESSPNKLTAKIVSCGDWLRYEIKLRGNTKGVGAFLIALDKLEPIANALAKSKVSFTGEDSQLLNVVVDSGSFSRQYKLECPPIKEFPPVEFPEDFAKVDTKTFISHLENATPCTSKEPSRYSFNMVELDGDKGRVVATDGRQLFCGNSLQFPWPGKKYLKLDSVLASKSIVRSGEVGFSATKSRFFVRFGPWTLSQFIDCTHFPDVDPVIPAAHDLRTSIALTNQQAKDLLDAIAVLPGDGENHSAIKLSARDKLTVSALDENNQERFIELGATISDVPRTTCFNRRYLVQALEAGFRQFYIAYSTGAIISTSDTAKYMFMPIRGAKEEATEQNKSPRVEADNESEKNDSATATASTISNVSTENISAQTSTTLRKEQVMENNGTATLNPPNDTQAGKPEGQKTAQTTGQHPLPNPTDEVTVDILNCLIVTAKDSLRTAINNLADLQSSVKEFARQSKEREKQNSAAAKKLEVIQRMAA